MLNRGAVDRILWMCVLCLVTWCVAIKRPCLSWPLRSRHTRSHISVQQHVLLLYAQSPRRKYQGLIHMLWYLDTLTVHRPDVELGRLENCINLLQSAFHIVTQQVWRRRS
jgi:hypothetical protein